ncbi:DUF6787 family protein [Flavobacteriaceae sp. LMIT009]
MRKFKDRWEIKQNWQLLFPFLGILFLLYSCYKLAAIFFSRHERVEIPFLIITTIVLYFIMLKITLWLFKKLEKKWILTYKWEMIRVFLVFAMTGSSSVFISKPLFNLLGINKENLNIIIYWILYVFVGLIFYQILLVTFGWLFGQFQFFWNFEKKMLIRIGFKRFLK